MRYGLLVLKVLVLGYMARILLFLLTGYEPQDPSFSPPFGLFVLDTVNLFIHEAGHFFFKWFGRWVHVLAGSVFQVALPALLLAVTWRQKPHQIAYPAFWVGENMVNVSVYIRDAPYRQLKLIAKGLIHDWWWLLDGDPEVAEPLGAAVYWLGILVCAASIGAGAYFAVRSFREGLDLVPEE